MRKHYTINMNKKGLGQAFKVTIPVLFGYITLGIAFGLVLTDANYPWWLAPIMSVFIYAGAAQFIAIGLFAAGTPITAILLTEALVNVRHIVYGLSLITKYKDCGKWKPYLIFALTDETYSLLTTVDIPEGVKPSSFYGFVSLLDQCYWVTGSIIGALIGQIIPFDLTGVDFSLTALFAVLTVEQLLKTKDVVPILIGTICTITSICLWRFGVIASSSNILLIALCAGIAGILLCKYRKEFKKIKNDNSDNPAEK